MNYLIYKITNIVNDKIYIGKHQTENINDNYLQTPNDINWIEPNSITEDNYTDKGNYDINGNIKISDYGPGNIEQLIKNLT